MIFGEFTVREIGRGDWVRVAIMALTFGVRKIYCIEWDLRNTDGISSW